MTLYTKYRPKDWDEVATQNHITTTLINALERGEVAQTLLFTGRHGTGKTTVARILARKLGAKGSDIVEIDAASNRGIDDARRLREDSFFIPIHGETKVFIIDECHMLTKEANNALLKILEEPPQNVFFILCTTVPDKLLPTVLSRCQRHNFKAIAADVIVGKLGRICAQEKLQYDQQALELIAAQAKGSMRDAESMLDLFSNYGYIEFEKVRDVLGLADNKLVKEMIDGLAEEAVGKCLNTVAKVWESGNDLSNYCHQIVNYLRGLMLSQLETPDPALFVDESDVGRFSINGLRYAIGVWNSAALNTHKCQIPTIELECAIIDCYDKGISIVRGDF